MPAAPGYKQLPRPQEVFISYSRKDEFVRRLDEELKRRDREAWVDWEDIRPTEEWMRAIYGAIEGADTFVFVLTPDSVASVVCGREIAHAAAHNKRMVPIVARTVNDASVPEALAKFNYIFFRESDDFEEATDKLISALDTDLDWVRVHTRLLTRAIEWDANGRNRSFVLRGDDLRAGEQWLAQAPTKKEAEPTALQTEYIIASRKAAARRQRITLAAVTLGLVIAIVLAVVAFFEQLKAKEQTKKASEAASRGNVSLARYSKEGGNNAQSLAYLAEALRMNPENREASGLTAVMLTQLGWHVPLTRSMQHDDAVRTAEFSPDGQKLVTLSSDNTARLWDAATGKPVGEPMKHHGYVYSARFSPDGQHVLTASTDGTARLWDAASGKPLGEPMKHGGEVTLAQFSSDSQRVVTTSRDKTARLWDAANGKPLGEPMKHESGVHLAEFSPDGQRVVTASGDKTWLWDAIGGKQIGEPMKHRGIVISAHFSPDGQRVVTASEEDETARLWDAISGKPIGEPMKHENRVSSVQFSPDGQRVVTASSSETARLWDAISGKALGEPMKHHGYVSSAQFSPDGQRVLTASTDGTARLWDVVITTNRDTRDDIFLLAELAEATGGATLETSRQVESLTLLTPEHRAATREKIAAKHDRMFSGLTPLQRLLKWSASHRREQPISPLARETVSEWLENRIKERTVEGLRAAMQVDPANARITAHLGRGLADQAIKQGVDPEEARRARGEADFLTRRALKLAPDNDEVKKLRDEVMNLLQTPVESTHGGN